MAERKARALDYSELSQPFKLKSGVRTACLLFLALFRFPTDWIMEPGMDGCQCVRDPRNCSITNLEFSRDGSDGFTSGYQSS